MIIIVFIIIKAFNHVLHHFLEFLKFNLAVAVDVGFFDDAEPNIVGDFLTGAEDFFDLVCRN